LTRIRARIRRACSDDHGFLMIEVIVALMVFALLASEVAIVLSKSLNTNRSNRRRVQATSVAQNALATVRSQSLTDKAVVDPTKLLDGTTTSTVVVDGVTFTVDQTIATTTSDQPGAACESASGDLPAYKAVSEVVSWERMESVSPVRTQTLIALPVGAVDPAAGAMAVAVRTTGDDPVEGAVVRLKGSTFDQSQATDENGCTVFVSVPPAIGTYTVTVTKPGFVDATDATTTTLSSLTVDAGKTGKTTVKPYEDGADITVDFTTLNVTGYTLPSMITGTLSRTGKDSIVGGTGFPRVVYPLYTGAGAYSAWSGICTDAMPSSPPVVAPAEGESATVKVPTASITVVPVNATNVAVTAGTLYAVHVPDGDCVGGESYNLGALGAVPLKVSLPYGTWWFKVDDVTTTASAFTTNNPVVLDETDTNPNPTVFRPRVK
jgi:type II secretory pathway pseudopilin PulG